MRHETYLKRTWAEIDLDALRSNYNIIRKLAPERAAVMSVVKADAYGHGAVETAKVLEEAGCGDFAVSNAEEGLCLRRGGIGGRILVLGTTPPQWAKRFFEADMQATIVSRASAAELSSAAASAGGAVPVHIKIETGMGRLGIHCRDNTQENAAVEDIKRICDMPGLDLAGIYTHFACADMPDPSHAALQYARFESLLDRLESAGLRIPCRHCSNSAAALRFPEYSLDMVRPGIALYGLYPDNERPGEGAFSDLGLRPAMSLKSVIVQKETYEKSSTVSYGAFSLPSRADIAVMAAGYADGYSRLLSHCGEVLLRGERVHVVGRVCMDMTMLDVTGSAAAEGDEVLLFGIDRASGMSLPVEEVAAKCGTLHYELLCSVGRRVPRVYVRDGKECAYSGLLGHE